MRALRVAVLLALAAGFLPAPPADAERPAPRLPRPSRPGLDPGGQRDRLRPPPVVLPPRLAGNPRCETTTSTGAEMTLVLDAPLPGTVLSNYEPDCPTGVSISGEATAGLTLSDLYFIIDSSGSTAACSGSDIDQDGEIGVVDPFTFFECSDQGDIVLAAEVRAVRDFVATLNPSLARVAIIQFSMPEGSFGIGERQRIVQSLTSNFGLVSSALDEILAFGPAGATDYGGALSLLVTENLTNGLPLTRRQHSYFISDGVPTFPDGSFGAEDPGDSQSAIDGADQSAALGIRVDTFGVGFLPSVTLDPVLPKRCLVTTPTGPVETSTLECVALRTGGKFFESDNPADIVEELRRGSPVGIERVTVANLTTGDSADATLAPSGDYVSPIALQNGVVNDILVTAFAEDGTTCLVRTDVLALCFAAGCEPLTQGYWHRQCLGLGLIDSGGVGAPPHPDWEPEILLRLMVGLIDPRVEALGFPADTTACEGLDAVPEDDPCQRAIKQYTAVLLNIEGGKLGPTCLLELPDVGIVTPAEAESLIGSLIRAGLAGDEDSCKRANDLADLINTGAAVL